VSVPRETRGTERTLGRVLTLGVRVSTACLVTGLLLRAVMPGRAGVLLLHAGIVVLMATPALRVAVSIASFARRREWWLVSCAAAVLVMLIAGIGVAALG
jgi:uncharacterized membrane protein